MWENGDYLTMEEAAQLLGMSHSDARKLFEDYRLPDARHYIMPQRPCSKRERLEQRGEFLAL